LSHPLLDLLNTYGVRLLMPFSNRWFYGDALFIIDVWLWLALLVGIFLSRRRSLRLQPNPERPARVAMALLGTYIIAMAVSSRVGRAIVERQASGDAAERVMVSPVPLTPLRRMVVRDLGDRYEMGELVFGEAPAYRPVAQTSSGRDTDVAAAAAHTPDGAAFLSWSRFPRFAAEPGGDTRVRISDMRYADVRGRGWASVLVRIPSPPNRSGLTSQ
jgi:inner membrane protein